MFVKDVAILGGGMTRFGKLDDGLLQLLVKASMKAFEDSKTSDSEFDHVYVGNMASGEFWKFSCSNCPPVCTPPHAHRDR